MSASVSGERRRLAGSVRRLAEHLGGGAPAGERAAPVVDSATHICKHCGTRFTPLEGRADYCCAGCEYVHRLITGQKLDRFYELRTGAVSPVRPVVFQPRDYRWLEGLVRRAERAAVERVAVGRVSDPPSSNPSPDGSETRPTVTTQQAHTPRRCAPPLSRGDLSGDGSAGAAAAAGVLVEAALDLDLQGISCVGCVWLIDRIWRERAGARGIRVNATLGRVHLRWDAGACDVVEFARELQRFGYLVGPATKATRAESSALVRRIGLCAAFAMNAMLFALPPYLGMQPDFPFAWLFTVLGFVFATLSVLVGGTYFFNRSWRSLQRGVLHIDLPIALGILAGYAGSIYAWTQANGGFVYFDFVSTFTFLMLVGRWTQMVAVERNRNQLLGLRQELPEVELIEDDDAVSRRGDAAGSAADRSRYVTPSEPRRAVATKPAEALDRGDRFRVEPGGLVPVSGALIGAAGSFGMDWISGESEARVVAPGQIVESGAINLSPHALALEALEPWGASLLARLLAVAPQSDWRNRTLERVIRNYLVVVLAAAAIGGAIWFVLTRDVTATLQVVVSVLVVSCPCAVGVTLPFIDELGVARLRHAGVFVRSETLWARLRRVRKVIFDKTGTLTLESLALRNPESLAALGADARAALWSLVRLARHPVAACLREAMLSGGWAVDAGATSAAVREEVGSGLEYIDAAGRGWRLGRVEWVEGERANHTGDNSRNADTAFGCDGRVLACFNLAEEVRNDARDAVARLRARGLEVFILSGDRAEKVAAMAQRLDLSAAAAVAATTPGDKAEWVRRIDRGDTLMIGDGANDSLAFAAATCRGTPAIERGLLEHRADFFFLGRTLGGIERLFGAAQLRQRTMARVLTFTLGYNVVVVSVALAGAMNPLLAAVLMPASALVSLAIAALGMRRA